MKKLILLITVFIFVISLSAHPWKPSHYVIIDCDGGIDDIKAITMLLASPDVRVLAITASSGVLNSDNTYIKLRSLLNSFHHEGIPAGISRKSKFVSPGYKTAAEAKWGNEDGIDPAKAPEAIELIKEILRY